MKKRTLLTLALLVTMTMGAWAQGAGLSQGEAVKQITVSPTTTTRKTCPNCGITMGNVTYPWQHESWCPHYRSSGGSSSSSRSSSSSYGAYTAASAVTSALGSLLSGMISNRSQSTSTPKPQKTEEEIKNSKVVNSKASQFMLADEKFWEVGDYAVVKGNQKVKFYDGKNISYGIKNTKTGNYVINPFNSKPNEGDYILFRGIKDATAGNTIRLYEPPAGDPTGKPIVRCIPPPYKWEIPIKDGRWKRAYDYSHMWFQINDQDKLEELEEVKLNASGKKTSLWYIKRCGKIGVYELIIWDEYTYDSYGLATGIAAHHVSLSVIIPIIYDAIKQKGSYFQAIKADGFDLYNGWDLKPANPELKKYDELNRFDNNRQDALLNGKYGMVDDEGRVIIPFIYNSKKELTSAENKHFDISYTKWYKQEAARYIDKKGEFEKTDHFEARMNDAKLQEEYLREVMADAPQRYFEEKVWKKGETQLTLGEYNADEECFPIVVDIAPWNSIMLPVPMAEAKAFKKEFASIKSVAAKTAQLGIRYDAPSIETINFTMSNGKKYYYGER